MTDKPVSVMIADSSETFRKMLGELIDAEEDMFVAALAEDGAEAAKLAEEMRPDVLITELLLREMEGVALIRRLKENSAMPYTIVVSGFFNDGLAEMVSELGVKRFFPKPCRIAALIEAIRAGRSDDKVESQTDNKEGREKTVDEALLRCGFNPYVRGWRYLREAILAAYDAPELLDGVTKVLYPDLARTFDTSAGNFERCIRSAMECAWRDGSAEDRADWFGPELAPLVHKKPGNTKFMKVFLERLRKG